MRLTGIVTSFKKYEKSKRNSVVLLHMRLAQVLALICLFWIRFAFFAILRLFFSMYQKFHHFGFLFYISPIER